MFEWKAPLAIIALVLALLRAQLGTVVVTAHEAMLLIQSSVERGWLPVGVHRFFLERVQIVRSDLRDELQTASQFKLASRGR